MNRELRYFYGEIPLRLCGWEYAEKFFSIRPDLRRVGIKGRMVLFGRTEDGRLYPVERQIRYSVRPSLHECDARCMGASPNGACECRCGGKNHGIGTALRSENLI